MGCAIETPKPKRRRKSLSAPRPYCQLSDTAKARARDCWREQGWTWDEWDSDQLTEFFQQELECAYGIDDAKVEWDLGYSQGDHVTFKASPRIERMAERSAELAQLSKAAELLTAASGGDDVEWETAIDEHRAYVAYWAKASGTRTVVEGSSHRPFSYETPKSRNRRRNRHLRAISPFRDFGISR